MRQVSQPVNEVNKEIQKLLDDMLETMYSANGIGLAAIQIGIPKNLIVIYLLTKEKKKDPMYFINPKILKKICPGVFGTIKPVGYCMIGKRWKILLS